MERQTRQAADKKTKCLTCSNKSTSLGLCPACRAEAKRVIRDGIFTEDELASAGLIGRRRRNGRKAQSGMARYLVKLAAKLHREYLVNTEGK